VCLIFQFEAENWKFPLDFSSCPDLLPYPAASRAFVASSAKRATASLS